jgi:hypothetical protein
MNLLLITLKVIKLYQHIYLANMGKILFYNTKLQLHVSLNACMSIIAKGKIIKNKKCSHLVVSCKFDLLFNFVSNSMPLKSITPILQYDDDHPVFPFLPWNGFL